MTKSKTAGKFPLRLHKTGQWTKKVRGRSHYFGTDQDAALTEYMRVKDDLEAGRTPREKRGSLPVVDLVNAFLNWKREKVRAGELGQRSFDDYHLTAEKVIDCFGRARVVEDLRPDDFGRLRAAVAKTLGPAALSRFITMTKTLFAFAFKTELIDVPVRYGNLFDKPPRRVMRLERHRKGEQLIAAADLWKLIDAADVQVKAMILLGINAAFGAKDCSDLPREALTVKPGWLSFPRPKSGIARRCPLWPETVAALAAVSKARPDAKDPEDAGQVFLTRFGNRWCRRIEAETGRGVNLDPFAQAFKKLCKAAGVSCAGPYTLRRTFRTVADEVRDEAAIDCVMGHTDEGMGARYRQKIEDDRLEAVAGHVRKWFLAGKKSKRK